MLSAEELSHLLTASAPLRLRGRVCRFSNGLVGIFNVTDLPLILSGSSIYLFDPTGSVLSSNLSEGQQRPQVRSLFAHRVPPSLVGLPPSALGRTPSPPITHVAPNWQNVWATSKV